jgi:hypothetical protein
VDGGLGWHARHGQAEPQKLATSSTREAAMPEERGPEREAPGDYEYDEAHDAMDAAHTAYAEAKHTEEAEAHVSMGPIDQDGDYGYDMAHDAPH